ncbi:unnamed protein product [Mytilus coruscus]|uniref:Zinc finger PHD-type domain-containing protein n=1 Tax=Mytilus coruscus TaxID=42192 RepID=A0A6J8CVC4_MYTCO|nr:unnamed protein product [Mytilus coruscus]
MLTLTLWTRQTFTVHQVILSPQHQYKPTYQDCIYKNNALEGVNIYLSEHHLNPVTSSVQTYYWIKSCKKHMQLTQQKFKTIRERSTQRLILLLLSGIETNPGPRRPRFPCTICQKACKIESIACDDCDKWTHRNCIGMSTSEYSNLGKSEDTWTCPSYCKPNNSSTKIYFIPNGDDSKHSTLNISTNPLMADTIIESTEPDVIKGTETWLDPNIKSSEIIPDYFHYDTEHRDRPKDPHGGVMIAAKQTLRLGNIIKSTDIELLTGTINLEGKKKILIGAFYRPHDKTDDTYLNKMKDEINNIRAKHQKDIFLIGGDFNLPDINWAEQTIDH